MKMSFFFFCDILAVTQQLRDSLSFMGPKISLPCPRDPTTVYCIIFNPDGLFTDLYRMSRKVKIVW